MIEQILNDTLTMPEAIVLSAFIVAAASIIIALIFEGPM